MESRRRKRNGKRELCMIPSLCHLREFCHRHDPPIIAQHPPLRVPLLFSLPFPGSCYFYRGRAILLQLAVHAQLILPLLGPGNVRGAVRECGHTARWGTIEGGGYPDPCSSLFHCITVIVECWMGRSRLSLSPLAFDSGSSALVDPREKKSANDADDWVQFGRWKGGEAEFSLGSGRLLPSHRSDAFFRLPLPLTSCTNPPRVQCSMALVCSREGAWDGCIRRQEGEEESSQMIPPSTELEGTRGCQLRSLIAGTTLDAGVVLRREGQLSNLRADVELTAEDLYTSVAHTV